MEASVVLMSWEFSRIDSLKSFQITWRKKASMWSRKWRKNKLVGNSDWKKENGHKVMQKTEKTKVVNYNAEEEEEEEEERGRERERERERERGCSVDYLVITHLKIIDIFEFFRCHVTITMGFLNTLLWKKVVRVIYIYIYIYTYIHTYIVML